MFFCIDLAVGKIVKKGIISSTNYLILSLSSKNRDESVAIITYAGHFCPLSVSTIIRVVRGQQLICLQPYLDYPPPTK